MWMCDGSATYAHTENNLKGASLMDHSVTQCGVLVSINRQNDDTLDSTQGRRESLCGSGNAISEFEAPPF